MYEEQNQHCYRGYLIGFLQIVVLGKLLGLRLSGEAHNNLLFHVQSWMLCVMRSVYVPEASDGSLLILRFFHILGHKGWL